MLSLIVLAATAHCAPVEVTVARRDMPAAFGARQVQQTKANFAKAYAQACSEGLLRKKPLVTTKDHRLFLLNAPDANIASIYPHGGRILLEYPFVAEDRKTHAPSADELHEAIYCAVHGASAKEQEASGRCLPD